jgi:hypothetical protein
MKKIILALLLPVLTVAFATAADKEHKREITKEFSVSSSPGLKIMNKYGNIRVIEGKENSITFKIEIIGKGNTEQLAKEYAETVSIDFSQNGNIVTAETKLKSINCNNCGRSINYTVIAPKSVSVDLENKYGNIYLEDVKTSAKIELQYGNLQANSLAETKLEIKYGKVDVKSGTELMLDSKYSEIKFGRLETMKADSKYDKFNIGTISNLILETAYTDVKIDKLNQRFLADDFKYCKLNISEVATNFSEIKINAAYSGLNIGLTKNHSFKASLYTRYGKIKANNITFNNVTLKKEDTIVGTAGSNSNPSATVDISASYGDIVFK